MENKKTHHEEKSEESLMRYDGANRYSFTNVGIGKVFLFWAEIHLTGVKYKIGVLMKLLTKKIIEKAHKQYDEYDCDIDQDIIAKFFNPCGDGTWYLMNMNKDNDYCWGVVSMMGNVEVGSFSMVELKNINLMFGLKIERDLYFEPIKSSELIEKLNNGIHV